MHMTTDDAAMSAVPTAMPLVVGGPWTREARERAAAGEAHEAFIRYFRKAMKVRNWTPWDDLPLGDMRERGHLLSEDTMVPESPPTNGNPPLPQPVLPAAWRADASERRTEA